MSFSFQVTAPNKEDAKTQVATELTAVVLSQPSRTADWRAARDAACALVDMLTAPAEGEVVHVTVSGSLSWRAEGDFYGAQLSVNASLQSKG